MSFCVYILRCADGSYYVGHTEDLARRMAEHEAGTVPGYTSMRRPVTLVFAEPFETRDGAFQRERQVKNWSREKKEALIRRDWERLHQIVHAEWRSEGLPLPGASGSTPHASPGRPRSDASPSGEWSGEPVGSPAPDEQPHEDEAHAVGGVAGAKAGS